MKTTITHHVKVELLTPNQENWEEKMMHHSHNLLILGIS